MAEDTGGRAEPSNDYRDGAEQTGEILYYYHNLPDHSTPAPPLPPPNSSRIWREFFPPVHSPSLWELNKRKCETFYPVFIFLALVLVLGVLTNVIVCYIYRCRSRRATSNFLVIFFALFDISGCVVCIPMIVTTLALPYKFDVSALCKIVGFVETCSVCSLCLTLTCAALISYRQLCCSWSTGRGVRSARWNCAVGLVLSVVFSIPSIVVYGVNPVQVVSWRRLQGESCGPDLQSPKWLLYLHYVLVLGCFTAALALMTLFYGLVGVQWCKRRQAEWRGEKPNPSPKQFPKKHRFVREETSTSSTTTGSYSEEIGRLHTARTQCHTSTPHHHSHHHHHHHQNTDTGRATFKSGHDAVTLGSSSGTHDRTVGRGIKTGLIKSPSSQHTSLLQDASSQPPTAVSNPATSPSPVVQLHVKHTRQAAIFSVISVMFVVTMMPYVVVQVLFATTEVFSSFSSDTTEMIVKLCLHSYLLNYIVKPIVYIIFNINFREEVKQLFLKLWLICPGSTASHRATRSEPGGQHTQMRSTSNPSIYRPANTAI